VEAEPINKYYIASMQRDELHSVLRSFAGVFQGLTSSGVWVDVPIGDNRASPLRTFHEVLDTLTIMEATKDGQWMLKALALSL
jgi:hypothetical protein